MRRHHNKCLLLNADYMPLSIIDWQKAIVWMIRYANNNKYGIEILDFYKNDYILCTNNKKQPIPSVAKTQRFFNIKNSNVTFSRKNIFLRDNYTCQYCNEKFDHRRLTYDHVIPKSKWNYDIGSPTVWTNIVTACVRCNLKKGNRTPKQANMLLINIPMQPDKTCRYLPIAHHLRKIKDEIPCEWKIYLPPSYI